ncbi:MAG: triacylglycerol lipase [Deltaproteobacteria bacterium]|nr:triacylglycerol lipase [Nannocystaceae bacterium]
MRRAVVILAMAAACAGAPAEPGSSESSTANAIDSSAGGSETRDADSSSSSSATTLADGSGDGDGSESSTGVALLGPPYPIVLVHGFFGFDELAGIDAATYFFGVVERLEQDGELEVHTPALDPFNDSTVRGLQLLDEVQLVLAASGHAKVNLVGHSQGGLDARVVASLRPDLVASVTTIATPHHGTPVADIVLGVVPDPQAQALADALAQLIGGALWSELDANSSVATALAQLTTAGVATFNATYPDAPGVPYRSFAGRSSLAGHDSACVVDDAPTWITAWNDTRDPVDSGLALTASVLSGSLLDPAPNDGLVRAIDARWGDFRGCVPADHLDEIGQLFGDGPGLGNGWSHLELYASIVAELRADGF